MVVRTLIEKAIQKATKIFQIKVPMIIDEKPLPNKPSLEQMGYYDCYKDRVVIYINKIQQVVSTFGLELEKMITSVVCHEIGHAKQARIFEDNQVCPWIIQKHRKCCVKLEGVEIPLKITDISFVNNWVQDFCVNKELFDCGIADISVKVRVKDLKLEGPRDIVSYVRMKHLPMDITLYEFGGLSDSERERLKQTIKNCISEKWDTTYDLMKSLHFAGINEYLEVIETLIADIFGQKTCFLPKDSRLIFEGKNRPSFWNKNNYNVLQVFPKDMRARR